MRHTSRMKPFQRACLLAVTVVTLLGGASCTSCTTVPPPPDVPECSTVDACTGNQVCANGACVEAPECLAIDDWPFCREALDGLQAGLGRTSICTSDGPETLSFHCHVACETDDQCASGSLCTDFGQCVPGLVRAPPGTPVRAHAPLLAGVGEAILDVPVTTSLGGLSSRASPGDGRWADGMDAGVGHLEGLWARAASLDSGDGRLLVIRLPIIFPTGAMTEAIAQRLQDETGDDYRDALVVAGTHTHSGPARFLPLLGESEAVLGPFGIGTFRQEVFDRIVESSTAAALAAISSQAPARLGWDIVEDFDSDDALAQDRRSESPDFDDNRALLIRVDDDAGLPLFVLTSFGVHPTDNGTNWATNEICGGVERALEASLFPIANRVVPVLFLNGAGGSMSPAAGGHGFQVPHGADYTGAIFVERVLPSLLAIETKADVPLSTRVHRFAMTTKTIGYAENEWFNPGAPPFGGEVTYGGLNCFRGAPDDVEPFDGHIEHDDMSCGISFHTFLFNHPPSVFQRTQVNAISVDGLSMLTLPGELTMELGWGLAAALQRQSGIDPLAFYALGYANDHLMYLLPTSLDEDAPPWPGYTGPAPSSFPPFAFSPLRGGFEADTSIFGDLAGDYMIQESLLAWQRLEDGTPATEEIAPPVYSTDIKAPIPVDDTPANRVGTVLTPLPATVARRTPVSFTFVGGDVAVEGQGAEVALVRDDGTPVLSATGRPFSTNNALFPLSTVRVNNEWHWTALLEVPADFPLGDYKLEVSGHVQQAGAVVPYTLSSTTFSVEPTTLTVTAVRDGDDLVVRAGYATDVPTIDGDRLGGRLHLVDHRVRSGRLAPLPASSLTSVTVSAVPGAGGAPLVGTAATESTIDGDPATTARVVGVLGDSATVTVTDAAGNVGTVVVDALVP